MNHLQRVLLMSAGSLMPLAITSPGGAAEPVPQTPTAQAPQPPAATTGPATTRPDMTPVTLPGGLVERDVPYVDGGSRLQRLDLYTPRDVRDAAVVIFVHGGEWTKGDKAEVSYKPKFLNENGVVFVSVNYRLSGTDKHPAQVNDVAAAVRWVRDHVETYGGSPRKLVLMGHSAGCHLVTLAALDPRPLATVGMKPNDLAAVVAWSGGAYDLVDKVKSGGSYAQYIRANFGAEESSWRDASPMNHARDVGPPLPTFLFASAEAGNPASREASEKMVAMINDAGGKARAVVLSGKNHSAANHEAGMPGDASGPILIRFVAESTENPRAR